MKFIILTCLVAYAFADVSHLFDPKDERNARIIGQTYKSSPDGSSFEWLLETENGIKTDAQGQLSGGENSAVEVQGSVAYTAPNGEPVLLSYVADANGYHPQGSHLPTSPPIPAAIARSLEYIAQNPPKPEVN